MKLPHRSLRLLAACARTALSSTLARYTTPATVCGAPCRRVLCLGDGDLSCSAALADAGVDVMATTLDTRDDLLRKYGEEAAARFDRLGAVGGVDATRPPDFGEPFDRVVFNFPTRRASRTSAATANYCTRSVLWHHSPPAASC